MRTYLSIVLSALLAFGGFASPAFAQSGTTLPQPSRSAGKYFAASYGKWQAHTTSNTAASAASIIVDVGLPTSSGSSDARLLNPFQNSFPYGGSFAPVLVDFGSIQDNVTTTATTGCTQPQAGSTCILTGTFTNAHGAGALVTSGSFGLQEAINDAAQSGGGTVVIDGAWTALGGTNAILTAAVVANNVAIEDDRGIPIMWTPVGGATALAAPAVLTAATALPSATPVGAYGTGTYHIRIAYVDAAGQEGPASADFSEAGLATGSFIFSPPAASTGAVGYTIYIGLTGGGSTSLVYKVPLTSAICGLTTVEITTAACTVTSAKYNQTGTTATVTAITVNTSPIAPDATVVSTTSVYVPQAGGRTTYAYAPTNHVGFTGVPATFLPFTISAADATVVPSVIGTVNLPPGFANIKGMTFEICGYATTTASAATIEDIQFQWDAFGQNAAGKGVPIGDLTVTKTATSVLQLDFCDKFQTTVAGASATAGSIQAVGGYVTSTIASLSAAAAGGNTIAGATASLNLASEARINVIYLHTTATDGTAITLQGLTLRVI